MNNNKAETGKNKFKGFNQKQVDTYNQFNRQRYSNVQAKGS